MIMKLRASNVGLENLFPPRLCEGFHKKLPSPLNEHSVIFTLYARNGLYAIACALRSQTAKRVILVPSYSCGDEIRPFLVAGFKIKPYGIHSQTLQIDSETLRESVDNTVAGILITHYFGFPQLDILGIKRFCEERNLFLIEDCAHVLGGTLDGIPLGTFGDAAVFSLRKFLPLPHGGALVINNSSLHANTFREPPAAAVDIDLLLFLGYRHEIFLRGTRAMEEIMKATAPRFDRHGPRLASFGGYALGLSRLSRFLIKQLPPIRKTLHARRSIYRFYLRFFEKHSTSVVRPLLPKLGAGVVPLFFPLLVKDSEMVYRTLQKHHIAVAQPFWSYRHSMVDWRRFPDIGDLKKRVLAFPVSKPPDGEALQRFLRLVR